MVERVEISDPMALHHDPRVVRGVGSGGSSSGNQESGGEMLFAVGPFEPTALANTETTSVELSFLPTSEKSTARRELRAWTNVSAAPFVLPVYS